MHRVIQRTAEKEWRVDRWLGSNINFFATLSTNRAYGDPFAAGGLWDWEKGEDPALEECDPGDAEDGLHTLPVWRWNGTGDAESFWPWPKAGEEEVLGGEVNENSDVSDMISSLKKMGVFKQKTAAEGWHFILTRCVGCVFPVAIEREINSTKN